MLMQSQLIIGASPAAVPQPITKQPLLSTLRCWTCRMHFSQKWEKENKREKKAQYVFFLLMYIAKILCIDHYHIALRLLISSLTVVKVIKPLALYGSLSRSE